MRTEVPFRLVGGDQPLIVVSARFNGSAPIDDPGKRLRLE
jgi:hypothetical protein